MIASVQILDFHLDENHFGLALSQVQCVVRAVYITPLPRSPGIILGVISLAGKIVPVLDIRERFGLTHRDVGIDDQFIIANTLRRTVAMVVNGVNGIFEYPADKIVGIDKFLDPPRQIEGVVQLETGLLLIHDLDRFLSLAEEDELDLSLSESANHEI